MQDKRPVVFATTLTERDWDMELSGWRCTALKIPGAQIDGAFVGGERVDPAWLEVKYELDLIRWIHGERPAQATILIKLTEELSTKELTLKWKKLAIILPVLASIAVALLATISSYFPRQPAYSPGNSNTANKSSTCGEWVKITGPLNLQKVDRSVMVEGVFRDLPADRKIWLVVSPSGMGRYYPQNPAIIQSDNSWLAQVTVGGERDPVKEFFIYAVIADRDAQEMFNNYVKRAKDENDSPGIPDLPAGAQVCQYIKVGRK